MKSLLLSFSLLFVIAVQAQPGTSLLFQQNNDTSFLAYSSGPDLSGGLIVAGGRYIPSGSTAVVMNINSGGTVVWCKEISDSSIAYSYCDDVMMAADGFYLLCNRLEQNVADMLILLKLDYSGNLIWKKKFSGPYISPCFSEMIIGQNGDILIQTLSYHYFSLIITDPDGNIKVSRQWGDSPNSMPYITCTAIAELSDGKIVLAGRDFTKAMMMCTDTSGNLQWSISFEDTVMMRPAKIICTSDGNILVAGRRRGTLSDQALMLKMDPVGNILWQKTYVNQSDPSRDGLISDVIQLPSGDLIAWGETSKDHLSAILTDNDGNVKRGINFFHNVTQQDIYAPHKIFASENGRIVLIATVWQQNQLSQSDEYHGAILHGDSALNFDCSAGDFAVLAQSSNFVTSPGPVLYSFPGCTEISSTSVGISTQHVSYTDFCPVLGTDESLAAATELSLYPNPVSSGNTVTISLPENSSRTEIFDLTGRKIFVRQNSLGETNLLLNTSSLNRGMYLVRILDEKGQQLATTKMIVE